MRALQCERCGAPVTFGSPFCGYCRAPLVWEDRPLLLRGAALETAKGKDFNLKDRAMVTGLFQQPRRNGAVLAEGKTRGRNAGFGVMARVSTAGSYRMAYALSLRPAHRSFQLSQVIWGDGKTEQRVLYAWECHPAAKGEGESNTLELRFADSLLQVVINGTRAASLVDAAFGFGQPGWRALCYGADACEVSLTQLTVHSLQ